MRKDRKDPPEKRHGKPVRPYHEMPRTLLLSSIATSWREWLKEHRGQRDLLCLDPGDPGQSPPGRVTLFRGTKPLAWRFYGSLDATRAPHVLVAALAQFLTHSSDDAIVQLFPARAAPLTRQLLWLCAQLVRPSEILAPKGSGIDLEGFPVGPEEVPLDEAFPAMVQQAQRKAQWLKLIESGSEHHVDLRRISIEGARLGSGRPLHSDDLAKSGLADVRHAEVSGGALLLIADTEPDDPAISRALDLFHASRAVVVASSAYDHLLCSFARQDGEDFGLGFVRSIDFPAMQAMVWSTAVPPAPVRILRLGGLRVDPTGRELGEARPWAI